MSDKHSVDLYKSLLIWQAYTVDSLFTMKLKYFITIHMFCKFAVSFMNKKYINCL